MKNFEISTTLIGSKVIVTDEVGGFAGRIAAISSSGQGTLFAYVVPDDVDTCIHCVELDELRIE